MNMTKRDLKEIVVAALDSEYGFAPCRNQVTLLEASGDGTKILFSVRGRQYRFSSYRMTSPGLQGTIWVGSGTVERVN